MTPAPKPEAATPQTRRLILADSVSHQPEEPRPAVKPGRTLTAGMERLLSIDDLAAVLNCSRRLVERMRSAGKVPSPDLRVGRMPRWRPETIRQWIEEGAHA
ncbi:MAG: helix-turn-helix transcriptional regulator [Isosphaeraceae bacterium]